MVQNSTKYDELTKRVRKCKKTIKNESTCASMCENGPIMFQKCIKLYQNAPAWAKNVPTAAKKASKWIA